LQFPLSQPPSVSTIENGFQLRDLSPTPETTLRKDKRLPTATLSDKSMLIDEAATGTILGCIPRFETTNAGISTDIVAARHVMTRSYREGRHLEHDSTMPQLRLSDTLTSADISLKIISAQKPAPSESIDKNLEANQNLKAELLALKAELEAERFAREAAKGELKRLADINSILSENNRLLSSRDNAVQSQIFFLNMKSYNDDRTRMNIIADLRMALRTLCAEQKVYPDDGLILPSPTPVGLDSRLGDAPSNTNRPFKAIRRKFVTVQSELDLTNDKLSASENRCNTLLERVSSLQRNIITCVDESAKALEVERELRFEIEDKLLELSSLN
jgi:hypothetical protein